MKNENILNKKLTILTSLTILSGCSSIHIPENKFANPKEINQRYSITDENSFFYEYLEDDISIFLAFSGGGARAAALSYGVLEELKNSKIKNEKTLEDKIKVISSVSGGSFTSAYYGLYKEDFYLNFKNKVLYKDISDELLYRFFNPFNMIFSDYKRADIAKQYYKDNIFGNATFKDLNKKNSPFIIINASDISTGERFSFTQEYFDLICSDINDYPIYNAVTASAAVPVLFEPIVIDNYKECKQLEFFNDNKNLSKEAEETFHSAEAYLDKDKNKYIHLIDGGITDNLGLLAFEDLMNFGEIKKNQKKSYKNKNILIIVVDASTSPDLKIGESFEEPNITQTINVVTDIQLHRYNQTTKKRFKELLKDWEKSFNDKNQNVNTYFIDINFQNTFNKEKEFFFNQIPTDMSLEKETIDLIIEEAKKQLRSNKEYNKLLRKLQ
ncbi:MAG: hypothetical protein CL760_10125 [Chloroflexi bacterium]|nr:hypothetical protein [Chloroflexota bacterium]|tara:strand:- start:12905 stop:14227 length:1323 start_codon:yes stop_codon:yes gene_type:complete